MKKLFLFISIISTIYSCSWLMIGAAPKEKNNLYYPPSSKFTESCLLRFDGVYINIDFNKNDTAYFIIRFLKSQKFCMLYKTEIPAKITNVSFGGPEGYFWTDCDSIKYHQQTRYNYNGFGEGIIENDSVINITTISFNKRIRIVEKRQYKFHKFED